MTEQPSPDVIQRKFSAQIARHRSRTLSTGGFLITASSRPFVLGCLPLPPFVLFAAGAGPAVWGPWFFLLSSRSALECPESHQGLERAIDESCPACGSNPGPASN